MDFTVELSKAFGISPFKILDEDKDKVIMMMNYFIEKSENDETTENNNERNTQAIQKNQRKRVNDKTASGGWF